MAAAVLERQYNDISGEETEVFRFNPSVKLNLTPFNPPFTIDIKDLERHKASIVFRMKRMPAEVLNGEHDGTPLIHKLLWLLESHSARSDFCDSWMFQLSVLCNDLCPGDGTLVNPYAANVRVKDVEELLADLQTAARRLPLYLRLVELGIEDHLYFGLKRDDKECEPENARAIGMANTAQRLVNSAKNRIKEYKHCLIPTLHSSLSNEGVSGVLILLIASFSTVFSIQCT
jgi:hypothetical protein